MSKQLHYTLTEHELSMVREAMTRVRRPEVRHRATALQLLHQGMKPQAVADKLAVSLGSIYHWHARWRKGGLDALANQPKSGAPPKADEAYWQRVDEVIEQEPSVFGDDFTVWTAERLIAHMVGETGIELSVNRFRVVLPHKLLPSIHTLVAAVLANLKHQNDYTNHKRLSICKDL